MAQGEFTKQETTRIEEAVNALFEAIPRSRRFNYLGHWNDIFLFLAAAKQVAQDESEVQKVDKPSVDKGDETNDG